MRDLRRVVTVDGLAGSGKTTLSRELAKALGYCHLNSGLLYRAVGWLVGQAGIDPEDAEQVAAVVRAHQFELREPGQVHLDGVQLLANLQEARVSDLTSRIAVHESVRRLLLPVQQEAFAGQGIVAEGRDMGTIVFPGARIKFFVVADEATRIKRRLLQLGGTAASESEQHEAIRLEIRDRDTRDSTRSVAPTVAAAHSIEINNSGRTVVDLVGEMQSIVQSLQDGL